MKEICSCSNRFRKKLIIFPKIKQSFIMDHILQMENNQK